MALVCFRSTSILRRFMELCADMAFLPWLGCKLSIKTSKAFKDEEELAKKFLAGGKVGILFLGIFGNFEGAGIWDVREC